MANPSKAKGTAAETALVNYARTHGFAQAQRLTLTGNQDRGDVILCPGLICEVKAHKVWSDLDIDQWLMETERERYNMETWYNVSRGGLGGEVPFRAFLVIRRPGKTDPAKWWVIERADPMNVGLEPPIQWRLADYFDCLRALGWGS